MSDNDADKRPRIYSRVATKDAEVECTVQGSEGETTEDIKETAEKTVDRLIEQSKGMDNNESPRGFN